MFQGDDVQTLLDKLGFIPGEIVEIILTTRGVEGELNAAPMGVIRVGARTLEVRPFLETRTYRNLRDMGLGVANITYDVGLFLETAFKRCGVRPEWFEEEPVADPPGLRGADALLFLSVLEESSFSEMRARFLCRVEWVRVRTPFPRAFSRGFAHAVEAIIHATRIEAFIREGRREEVDRLLRLFRGCRDVIERVSPEDSPNRRVVETLEDMIAEWMSEEWR